MRKTAAAREIAGALLASTAFASWRADGGVRRRRWVIDTRRGGRAAKERTTSERSAQYTQQTSVLATAASGIGGGAC
jgi:hypothetical protein